MARPERKVAIAARATSAIPASLAAPGIYQAVGLRRLDHRPERLKANDQLGAPLGRAGDDDPEPAEPPGEARLDCRG